MNSRTPRDADLRENTERKKTWRPSSLLPSPNPQIGWKFRWIRTASLGNVDNTNVSAKFREGWEPVLASEHPELAITSDEGSRFKEGVEVGGLLLCKTSEENVERRTGYFNERARTQIEAVDNQFLRDNDPRMPKMKESRTRTFAGNRSES